MINLHQNQKARRKNRVQNQNKSRSHHLRSHPLSTMKPSLNQMKDLTRRPNRGRRKAFSFHCSVTPYLVPTSRDLTLLLRAAPNMLTSPWCLKMNLEAGQNKEAKVSPKGPLKMKGIRRRIWWRGGVRNQVARRSSRNLRKAGWAPNRIKSLMNLKNGLNLKSNQKRMRNRGKKVLRQRAPRRVSPRWKVRRTSWSSRNRALRTHCPRVSCPAPNPRRFFPQPRPRRSLKSRANNRPT